MIGKLANGAAKRARESGFSPKIASSPDLPQTMRRQSRADKRRFLMKLMQKSQDLVFRRRTLPSLRGIVAFEAAARTQSFARAAEELSLSQSAVSRQIAQLETALGVALFQRVRQRVVLTPAGEFFAERMRDVTRRLRLAANETMTFQHGGGYLRLSVLPTFGTRWLIPRMSSFIAAHPGITVLFNSRLPGTFDFEAKELDAAIHFGDPVWPGAKLHLLRKDAIAVVAAPRLLDEFQPKDPKDLLGATLISHRSRPDAWPEWFEAHGVAKSPPHPELEFEQFTMVIQAAASGLGFAIVPTFMARPELQSGALVQLFDVTVSDTRGDYLAYPIGHENYPPLVAFREWILETMATDP